jgi:hypothetical protein
MSLTIEEAKKYFGEFTYKEIGNGLIYIDDLWVKENIVIATLPIIGTIKCHKKVAGELAKIFSKIEKDKKEYLIDVKDTKANGGCWVPRHMCWDVKRPLSLHAWGIAIDINPTTNPFGSKGTENQKELAKYFEEYCWEWGGRWKTPDPMHFQWALKLEKRNENGI